MNEQVFGLFRAVDFAISRFSQTLPYARNTDTLGAIQHPMGPNAPVNAQLVFVHTLALTATMRLHYLAAKDEAVSYSKRLNAAEHTVIVANDLMGSNVDYSEFDMLLGVSLKFHFSCPLDVWCSTMTSVLMMVFFLVPSIAGRPRATSSFSSVKSRRTRPPLRLSIRRLIHSSVICRPCRQYSP